MRYQGGGAAARSIAGSFLVALIPACSPEVSPNTTAVRDSLGTTIVENPGRSTVERLIRPGARTLEIRDEGLFRIGGIVRFDDGAIVVANRGTQSLHFYAPDGQLQRTTGGAGDGPGEFGSLLNIFRAGGDTIGAYDARNRRVVLFDRTGRHLRTTALQLEGLVQDVRGFGDGSLSALMGPLGAGRPDAGNVYQDTLQHLRLSADGEPVGSVGQHPGQIHHVFSFSINGEDMRVPTPYHYSPRAIVAISPSGYLVGDGAEYEIRQYSVDGRLEMIVRRGSDADRLPVTESLRRELISRRRDSYANAARRFERWRLISDGLDEVPSAEFLPAFGTGRHSILVDDSGGFWVAHFMTGEAPERFDVFAADGSYRVTAEMPAGFRAWVVSDEIVVGVRTSELDEEWIESYAIQVPS